MNNSKSLEFSLSPPSSSSRSSSSSSSNSDNSNNNNNNNNEINRRYIYPVRTNAPIKILCIGDSLTAGYSHFGTLFTPYGSTIESISSGQIEVDSIGMSGFTSTELLSCLDKLKVSDHCGIKFCGFRTQLTNKQYNLVLLMIGTNDLGTGVSLEELTSNIIEIKDICLQHCPKIVLLTLPSSRERQIIIQMNEIIKDIVQKNPSNTFLYDCYSFFNQKDKEVQSYNNNNNNYNSSFVFDNDGLHFSEYGSKILGEDIFSKLGDYEIDVVSSIRK